MGNKVILKRINYPGIALGEIIVGLFCLKTNFYFRFLLGPTKPRIWTDKAENVTSHGERTIHYTLLHTYPIKPPIIDIKKITNMKWTVYLDD